MKILKIGFSLILVGLVTLLISLPIATTPGFFIGGIASAAPTTWGNTSSIHEIKLRVPGVIPRVVIIWFVEIDNDLYIVGETNSGWASMLSEGGPVKLRLQDSTYPLQARLVNSSKDEILMAWQGKYRKDYPNFFSTSQSKDFLEYSSIYRLSRI